MHSVNNLLLLIGVLIAVYSTTTWSKPTIASVTLHDRKTFDDFTKLINLIFKDFIYPTQNKDLPETKDGNDNVLDEEDDTGLDEDDDSDMDEEDDTGLDEDDDSDIDEDEEDDYYTGEEDGGSPLYENGDYFEGDLAISKQLIDAYYGDPNDASISTNAARGFRRRWPNAEVLYKFDDTLHNGTKTSILRSMKEWSDVTCLKFAPQKECKGGCLLFFSGRGGCWSNSVGYKGHKKYPQRIHLKQPGCTSIRVIMHEIGHAIGLWHEQSRPDRDEYITINFENIKPGREGNFRKRRWDQVDTQGLSYDYASLMQYGQGAFSKNRNSTISITNKKAHEAQCSPRLGAARELSYGDYTVINRMYDCEL